MVALTTFANLPVVSPLTVRTSPLPPERQAQAACVRVGLAEIHDWTVLHLRGDDVERPLQAGEMRIGAVRTTEDGLLVRLRRDEFVLLTNEGEAVLNRFTALIAGQPITLTDITHGRCGMLLVGAHAADVLPKVCGLNFSERQFSNWHAAQTSLAKVRTLIVRVDLDGTPAYGLFVDRSLGAYVWEIVSDAAQEFGGVVCNKEGFDFLRKASVW